MSRRSRRSRTVFSRYVVPDSESNSENESESLQLMQAALKKFTKKRTTKKSPVTNSKVAKRTLRVAPEVIALDSDSHDNDPSEQVMKDNHQKNIQTKVDSFFKSSHLMSDDEEDEPHSTKPQTVKKSTVVSKEFYELIDSDDEKPSTSTSFTKITTSYSWSSNKEVIKPKNVNKEEELMEIVDKILESAPVETNPEPESWNEFKSKTEEILVSVNAFLGSLKNNTENKTVDLVAEEEKKPEKEKLSCPICLEVLDEDIVPGATLCGHIFCMECIKQVAKTSKSCPTCRKKITLKQIHPLYL